MYRRVRVTFAAQEMYATLRRSDMTTVHNLIDVRMKSCGRVQGAHNSPRRVTPDSYFS